VVGDRYLLSRGILVELSERVAPEWQILRAIDINDGRQILAEARRSGETARSVVLLTPR
jgi:hypothetical protein